MTARTMILAAGLLAGFAAPAWATDDVPVRGNWLWRAGWSHWPAIAPSYTIAPWYLWWPADATETLATQNFQSSPYPTWQAPHAARPYQHPTGMMTQTPYGRPIQQAPPQPVHYPASYPPNYYGR